MNIVPGYDFSVNEIPTRAKLGLMASGMSLTGISLDQIDGSVIVVTVTDGTQTSLPAIGWLWVDGRANIWGRTEFGNVIVRKSEGGWESNRIPYAPGGTASVISIPGEIVQFSTLGPGNTNATSCRLSIVSGGSSTGGTWHVGVSQETVPSGATDASPVYYRTVFRGSTRFFAPEFTPPANTMGRGRMWRSGVNSNWWIITDFDDNEARVMYGESNQLDRDNHTDWVNGYFFPGTLTS